PGVLLVRARRGVVVPIPPVSDQGRHNRGVVPGTVPRELLDAGPAVRGVIETEERVPGGFERHTHGSPLRRRTLKLSSGGGCKDFTPRRAVMPAPSAATTG